MIIHEKRADFRFLLFKFFLNNIRIYLHDNLRILNCTILGEKSVSCLSYGTNASLPLPSDTRNTCPATRKRPCWKFVKSIITPPSHQKLGGSWSTASAGMWRWRSRHKPPWPCFRKIGANFQICYVQIHTGKKTMIIVIFMLYDLKLCKFSICYFFLHFRRSRR